MPDLHGFGAQLLEGAAVTLGIALVSLLFGVAFGLCGAAAKLYGAGPLRMFAGGYTTVVRGVPDLLIIFVIYFGGSITLSKVMDRPIEVSAFTSGVVALSIVF